MNFGDFKRSIRLRLREGEVLPDDVGGFTTGDPFTLEEYIFAAADEVAFRTDSMYGVRTTSITAAKSDYCLPEFYKPKTIYVLDSDGDWRWIADIQQSHTMDRLTAASWRNEESDDPARIAVFDGVNGITLYPVPSVSRADGLAMEGFYKPSLRVTAADAALYGYPAMPYHAWYKALGTGDYDEVLIPIPITDDDECPLPPWSHEAVLRCAIYKRAADDDRPEIARRVPRYKDEYDGIGGELGRVEAAAAMYHKTIQQKQRRPGWWI